MVSPVLVLALAAIALGLFIAVWFAVSGDRAPRLLATRMARFANFDTVPVPGTLGPPRSGQAVVIAPPLDERQRRMSRSFWQRVVAPMFESLVRTLGRSAGRQKLEDLQVQLDAAGGVWGLSPQGFIGTRYALLVGGAAMGAGVGALLAPSGITMVASIAGLGILAFLVPSLKLRRGIRARRISVLDGMPNALDLLTVSVEAGLGFDAAMLRVSEKYNNTLSEELNRVLTEMKLGRPRREALKSLAERVQLDDMTTFVQAVVQSEQMGTGLSGVLRIQADEMRRRRRQRAEEAGAKAPLKMLLPMVGCIFPTLFIVLLGPAVLNVVHQFNGSP